MKKILVVSLALCLLVALFASFTVNTAAAEVDVSVGTRFEWNDQSEGDLKAWRTSKGKSPDGLWKYQYYAFNKDVYMDLSTFTSSFFAWSATPGDTGVGYARVRENGANFHPAELADVVKTFTCPSGGTVTIDTTIRRAFDWTTGSGTPTSFAIYVEDQLVYPTDGSEFLTLSSSVDQSITVDVEVLKNQRIYFRVGCMEDQGGDAVYMSNFVTYKSVTDEETEVSDKTISISVPTNTNTTTLTLTGDSIINTDIVNENQSEREEAAKTSSKAPAKEEEGSSMGLIIGIVAGAVVAAAAVVVVIIKKKK